MPSAIPGAVRALRAGRLVAYPTDTLYGLAARADDAAAVGRLVAAKGRAPTQPISIAVSSVEELEPLGQWTNIGRAFVRDRLPGPFTILVRASPSARRRFRPPVVGPDGTIGLRVPAHPVALELARLAGPITATSANLHGASPATGPRDARRAFGTSVAVYLDAEPAPSGKPSTLIDLRGASPRSVPRST